jgi:hypothetical protein
LAKPRYEHCTACTIRKAVEEHLGLPPHRPVARGQVETAAEFWARVERSNRLVEALDLYDRVAAEREALAHTRQETKAEFLERVEREGRREEVEQARAELVASGMTQREAQAALVERFQPLDGSMTRAWATPDPWVAGRLFRRKADQDSFLRWEDQEKDEYSGLFPEVAAAKRRVKWAKHRQEERRGLATARLRARALKAAAPKSQAVPPPSQPVAPAAAPVPAPPAAGPARREERQPAKAEDPPYRPPAPTNGETRTPAKAASAPEPPVPHFRAAVPPSVVCRLCRAAPSAPGYSWCDGCLSGTRAG